MITLLYCGTSEYNRCEPITILSESVHNSSHHSYGQDEDQGDEHTQQHPPQELAVLTGLYWLKLDHVVDISPGAIPM